MTERPGKNQPRIKPANLQIGSSALIRKIERTPRDAKIACCKFSSDVDTAVGCEPASFNPGFNPAGSRSPQDGGA